jgi:group I intron endonuclease
VDFERRFVDHRNKLGKNSHYNNHLQRAWNIDGEENFEFKVVEECSKKKLSKREKHYIKFYNARNSNLGYNQTDGGDGISNPSSETRQRMSDAKIGKKRSDETRKRMSDSQTGKKKSDETRKKISENHADFLEENSSNWDVKKEGSSSKYFGVTKRNASWEARIRVNGITIHIKTYKTELEAALAVDNYIISNNIQNRKLNFPEKRKE